MTCHDESRLLLSLVRLIGADTIIADHRSSSVISGNKGQILDQLGAYQRAGLHHLIGTPSSGDPGHHSPQRLMGDMQYVAEEILPAVQA